MLDQDNIWKDSFNNPNLDREKFLEPSADLFAGIEKALEPPKKKRRPFFWWIGFGSIVLIAFILLFTNQKSETFTDAKMSSNLSQATNDAKLNSLALQKQEKVNESLESKTKLVKPSKEQTEDSAIVKDEKLTLNSIRQEKQVSQIQEELINNQAPINSVRGNFIGISNKQVDSSDEKFSTQTILKKESVSEIKKLPVLKLMHLAANRDTQLDLMHMLPLDELNSSTELFKRVALGIGLSQWKFHLNSNYLTALDPADFSYDPGRGISGSFAYEQDLSKKFAWFVGFGLDRIESKSGHNSIIDYTLDSEGVENANQLNLTMASPFGLMQSNVVINRSGMVSQNSTELVLDLHNKHEFTILSFKTGLSYDWLQTKNSRLSYNFSFGFNYLNRLENDLESFEINSLEFESGATNITQNQQSVQYWTSFIDLGIRYDFRISQNTEIGVTANYSKGLSSIYREGDFSTELSALRFQALVTKAF